MPTIKATTPEELKAAFVLWARNEASQYGVKAVTSAKKKTITEYQQKSLTYSFIADYWEKMEIEK